MFFGRSTGVLRQAQKHIVKCPNFTTFKWFFPCTESYAT